MTDYKPKDFITAAVMKLSAAFLFAAMAVQVRYLGDRFSVGQVIFFRAIFAFVPILIFYAALGELSRSWQTKRFTGHVRHLVLDVAHIMRKAVQLLKRQLGLIDDVTLSSFLVMLIAIGASIALYLVVQWTGRGKFLFERPAWAHLPGTKGSRNYAAAAVPAE